MFASFATNGWQVPWLRPQVATLAEGLRYALAYADVFDYPLTPVEAHRYLVGVMATRAAVEDALQRGVGKEAWEMHQGYYTLPGRQCIIERRHQRQACAAGMWASAASYARMIARLPFVQMVALTGALTMGNVDDGADLDFLVVTQEGRVWVTRLLIVRMVVRPAARHSDDVCPNYLLAESAMTIQGHDLFHAHELTQMVPLYGQEQYRRFRAANSWTRAFLPNAIGPPVVDWSVGLPRVHQRPLLRLALASPLGNWLERQELDRMRSKLQPVSNDGEVHLSPRQCKGHLGGHGERTREAFIARLQRLV